MQRQRSPSGKSFGGRIELRLMKYTCVDYRLEMTLLGLRRRLGQDGLGDKERKDILLQIQKIEADMGID